jgi:hypothetical protein
MAWVRHHDKYTEGYTVDATQGYVQPEVVKPELANKVTSGAKCCHD